MTRGESNFKGGLAVKRNDTITSSNQAGQTDESLENDDDLPKANPRPQDMLPLPPTQKDGERHYSAELNEGKRAKRQQTRFEKKKQLSESSEEDEDEDETGKSPSEDEKEEFKGGEDKTGTDSDKMSEDSDVETEEEGSNKRGQSGSVASSNKKEEKQPLLAKGNSGFSPDVPKSG